MGNVEVTDLAPVRDDERKELNLSRKVNYKQYCKHVQGEIQESCLTDLPWSIVDSISLYERMDVSFNNLVELPVELPLRLPHLSHLNLSYNSLQTLPESFSLLFHLRTLLLSNNKISKLPNSLVHLVKLEKLDLSHNCIRELPEDLGNMEALSKLNVVHNKLRSLPSSLGKSNTLTVILASNNRLISPPQNVCNEGSEETIRYLKRSCPNGIVKPKIHVNKFPRVRGNQLKSAVSNPHSANAQYIQVQTHTTNTPSRIKTPLLPPLEATSLDSYELRDKIIGLIYGAAIGDAIGIATQFMAIDECDFNYDPDTLSYKDIIRDKHRVRIRTGDWTANFDHLCLVLDSVIHWGGVVDELDFASRLESWRRVGFTELGDNEGYTFNNTILKVLHQSDFTKYPHLAAQSVLEKCLAGNIMENSSYEESIGCEHHFADNGSLVRSLILGIPAFHDIDEVINNTIRICKATHYDPRCLAGTTFLTSLVAFVLQGQYKLDVNEDVDVLLEKAKAKGLSFLQDVNHIKDFNEALSKDSLKKLDVTDGDKTVFALMPISCLCSALKDNNKKDFRSTINSIIMRGGDSCTNASIVGAFLGCKVGYSHLPEEWVKGLRKKQVDWLNIKINTLLDMMGIP